MKPYTIVCGESYNWLRSLPDGHADGLVTDPPYSSGGAYRGDRTIGTEAKYLHNSGDPDFEGDNRDQRGFLAWATLWLIEGHRVLKSGSPVVLFTDWRQLPTMTDALQAGGFVWRGIAPWDKTEAARPAKGRFRSQCEYMVWGSKGAMSPDRGVECLPGLVRQMAPPTAERHHQTQKPPQVMDLAVRIVAPGGLILDPFMGSGSTGVAALEAGYQFAGCEVSAHYHEVAHARLEAAGRGFALKRQAGPAQASLFGGAR